MPSAAQIPFRLEHPPQYDADSFIAAPSNREALDLIGRWPGWPSHVVILIGPSGSGKTHLATIWSMISHVRIWQGADLSPGDPDRVLAEKGAVIEDIDRPGLDETALFHLINAAREAGADLLLTARKPLGSEDFVLPDLRSRLRMATPVMLREPEDDLLRQVLVKLLSDRQVVVDRAVIDFVLPRMERSLSAAQSLVQALDREALSAGRPITRPMAAAVLRRLGNDMETFPAEE